MAGKPDSLKPETLAANALGWIDEKTGAIVPSIHPSTTYLRDADNSYSSTGRVYSRADNPTYDQVEALLNTLEGGQGALVFSSGMAAATALFMSLKPGDHVVAPSVMYWSLRNWLNDFARTWGLDVEFVQSADLDALAKAMRPGKTALVWLETPSNPLWDVTDIQAASDIAHKAGARLAVDSTSASPVITRPLAFGADYVMHAGTKYLNGHSDVIVGALVTAAATITGTASNPSARISAPYSARSKAGCCCAACVRFIPASEPPRPTRSTSRATSKAIPAWRKSSTPACKAIPSTKSPCAR